MKKYEFIIEEMLTKVIEVDANNLEDAEKLVREKYKNEEIVLDADNLAFYDISLIGEEPGVIL